MVSSVVRSTAGRLGSANCTSCAGNASPDATSSAPPARLRSRRSSGTGASTITCAEAVNAGIYRQNWMVSPNPCSACSNRVRPAKGSPCHAGAAMVRALQPRRRHRASYPAHPASHWPVSKWRAPRSYWASALCGASARAAQYCSSAAAYCPWSTSTLPRLIRASTRLGARFSAARRLASASGRRFCRRNRWPRLLCGSGRAGSSAMASR